MKIFSIYIRTKHFILIIALIAAITLGLLLRADNILTTNDSLINYITGISTLITSFIILFTLFEMTEQRISTYKPVIVVKDTNIAAKWTQNTEDPLSFSFDDGKSNPDNSTMKLLKGLQSYNIGYGAAQNINISYDYRLPKIIREIKSLDCKSIIEINLVNSMISLESKSRKTMYSKTILREGYNIDYILPVNIDSNPTFIPLPPEFVDIFLVYAYLLISSKGLSNSEDLSDFNKFYLTIKYKDIGNDLYIKKFEVKLEIFCAIQNTENNTLKELHLTIKVREIPHE
jgi:hypothetical protein